MNAIWYVPSHDGDKRGGLIHHVRLKPLSVVQNLPVLCLDATADPEISRAVFGENVEFHHFEVPAQNVRVIQVADLTFPKGKVIDPGTGYQDRIAAFMHALAASALG